MMFKFKNSSKPTGTGTVKNFWVYALVLFTTAIILIMIGQYFQSSELRRLRNTVTEQTASGNQKTSMLQSVQELNESLQKQVTTLNQQLEEANGSVTSAQYDISVLQKDLSNTMIICEAESLYLSGKYKAGRSKLKEIDETTLSDTIRPYYDAAKKLIK